MDGIVLHLACRSSDEVVSCDLDALDQGTVTDSSSSCSPCPTPLFASVSETAGLAKPSHLASSQASTVSSRSSSLPDSITLPDTAIAAAEDATATQQAEVAQICFDFTKGMCTRGDKCKYSHDIATIVHFNSKEKGICFDYLRNQCHRGLLCRFSHDLSNIAQQCQVYSGTTAATVANKNGSASICYDFVKGVCTRGSECRYSHDLTLIARMARGSTGVHVDQGQQADVCFDYIRGRCTRGDTCKYSHSPAALHNPAAALNPLNLMTPWQLPGLNPQAAAAAAAAAAAIAAAGGVGPAAPLNPFAAAAAAGMGSMNPFARPGMFGLGADHLVTAATAASLAAASPAGTAGLLCGGLGPLVPPGGGAGLLGTSPLTRHCSLEGSACGTPTQITDAMQLAAAAAADPLALLTAMQQQQGLAATAAAASAAAAACSAPAMPVGLGAAGLDPLQMMLSADINRLLPKGSSGTVDSPTSLGLPRPYHRAPHGPPPPAAAAAPPGALLPAVKTATRFAPAGMTAPLKVAPAAGSFMPLHCAAYDGLGSKVSPDVSFPAPATATRRGPGLPPRAGSAVPDRHAAQQAPVGAATHLGRAASAPVPSQLQLQQVAGPRPAIAAAVPRQMIGGLTTSASASCFNPLAAGLSHLSLGNQEAADCAQVVGRTASADVGQVGKIANRRQAGIVGTPNVAVCDAEGVGSPGTTRAGGGDCKFAPDAAIGPGDELETGHELYGDLLPRIQAIWSR